MTRFFGKRLGNQKGFTLVELMIVVAIIGVLASVVIPVYGGVQTRARMAKAQGDTRNMAAAVSLYQAHMGTLPGGLTDLIAATTNAQGQVGGPFLGAVPTPPTNWGTSYGYTPNQAAGTFTIVASGDGTTITRP